MYNDGKIGVIKVEARCKQNLESFLTSEHNKWMIMKSMLTHQIGSKRGGWGKTSNELDIVNCAKL